MTELTPVLVVDDDPIDRESIARAIARLGLPNPLWTADRGADALRQLRAQSSGAVASPRPLVLLDLSMPGMSGFEFLEILRADHELASTTVFILTSSKDPGDMSQCRRLGVSGYLTKDAIAEDFSLLGEFLNAYEELLRL